MKFFGLRRLFFLAAAKVSACRLLPVLPSHLRRKYRCRWSRGTLCCYKQHDRPLYLSTFTNANANVFIEFSNNGGLADSTVGFSQSSLLLDFIRLLSRRTQPTRQRRSFLLPANPPFSATPEMLSLPLPWPRPLASQRT